MENEMTANVSTEVSSKGNLGGIASRLMDADFKTNALRTNDTLRFVEWQHYDQTKGSWVTTSRIKLAVTGGSDGGWRTFSETTPNAAGAWRVNVETVSGAIIGRIDFTVIDQTSEPILETNLIN